MSTTLPDKTNGSTGIIDTPTVGQQKSNLGALRDFIYDLFGGSTAALRTVWEAFRLHGQDTFTNGSLAFSVGANALTIALKTRAAATPSATDAVLIAQRSATAGNGDFNLRAVTGALSLTVSSGSVLGCADGETSFLHAYLIDNAGTQELAVSKAFFGASGIVSTTAEGGAGAADSASVMYSATARSNVPFRCIGRFRAPQTTAGTWTAVPTAVELWPFALAASATAYTAAQAGTPVALTDAATIAVNLALANNFTLTIGGNRTLGNPSNLTPGQSGAIVITQDGTGSRTLAYGSNWKFPGGSAPTLSTAAGSVDVLTYYVESSTRISANLLKGMA